MAQIKGLIFLGPPGSGKGTQAQLVSELFKLLHISTGEMLRSAISEQTTLGQKAQAYVERGELVPDQLLLDLITQVLKEPAASAGWILDGFPRTVIQAVFLDELLEQFPDNTCCAINLEVPDDVLVERLLKRGRQDDTQEIILNRLNVYHQQTAPVLDYYSAKAGGLHSVNGNLPAEEITSILQKIIQA